MSKGLFRSVEITDLTKQKVTLNPKEFKVEELPVVEEYDGPTVEELRKEADLFKSQWADEKDEMIKSANFNAQKVIEKAEERAKEITEEASRAAAELTAQTEAEAAKVKEEAQTESSNLRSRVEEEVEEARKKGYEEGKVSGREEGYEKGYEEAKRLVKRLHTLISAVAERKTSIINEVEVEMVNLILTMVKKVVKVLGEGEESVVVENAKAAVERLKKRGTITLRVNPDDMKLSTEHMKQAIEMIEGVEGVRFIEDTIVDRGGCIVESDFGSVDARLTTQLRKLEEQIVKVAPQQLTPAGFTKRSGEPDEELQNENFDVIEEL